MNIEESNKLIAEFMEWRHEGSSARGLTGFWSGSGYFTYSELKFHESWDWLMPVVDKIETLHYSVSITQNICTIQAVIMGDRTIISRQTGNYGDKNSKRSNTYLAVIEFIKWYNENKNI